MPNQPQQEAALEQAERDRQATQAAGHQAGRQADADAAQERAEAAQADADIDPNSQAGRQAAIRRGDSVQLSGEERDLGRVKGTATTSNESVMAPPGGHDFVTGAAGVPLPAGTSEPQRPGEYNPDMSKADAADRPARSAPKGDWVEYAVDHGMPQDEAEAKTKDDLITDFGG